MCAGCGGPAVGAGSWACGRLGARFAASAVASRRLPRATLQARVVLLDAGTKPPQGRGHRVWCSHSDCIVVRKASPALREWMSRRPQTGARSPGTAQRAQRSGAPRRGCRASTSATLGVIQSRVGLVRDRGGGGALAIPGGRRLRVREEALGGAYERGAFALRSGRRGDADAASGRQIPRSRRRSQTRCTREPLRRRSAAITAATSRWRAPRSR